MSFAWVHISRLRVGDNSWSRRVTNAFPYLMKSPRSSRVCWSICIRGIIILDWCITRSGTAGSWRLVREGVGVWRVRSIIMVLMASCWRIRWFIVRRRNTDWRSWRELRWGNRVCVSRRRRRLHHLTFLMYRNNKKTDWVHEQNPASNAPQSSRPPATHTPTHLIPTPNSEPITSLSSSALEALSSGRAPCRWRCRMVDHSYSSIYLLRFAITSMMWLRLRKSSFGLPRCWWCCCLDGSCDGEIWSCDVTLLTSNDRGSPRSVRTHH